LYDKNDTYIICYAVAFLAMAAFSRIDAINSTLSLYLVPISDISFSIKLGYFRSLLLRFFR